MHPSALNFGKLFFGTYCSALEGAVVHDVGAQHVNGSLKDVLPPHLGYVGIDFVAGKGVDIVLEDPYRLPFADGSLDVLVCSSCFEHSQFFWLVFLEMQRVLKPQGLLYLNVPSNGSIHRYPVDCWRFYPDSGRALEAWAARNGYPTQLLESFVGDRSPDIYESGGAWHDFVAVFVKDGRHAAEYPARMLDALQSYSNGYDSRSGAESRPQFLSPDHAELVARERAMEAMRQEHAALGEQAATLLRDNEELTRRGEDLRAKADELRQQVAEHHRLTVEADELRQQAAEQGRRAADLDRERAAQAAQLEQILRSRSWRLTAPVRKMMTVARVVRSSVRSLAGRRGDAAGNHPAGHAEIASEVATIRASGMFDEHYYRSEYADLALVHDPIRHYCEHGWREGRNPSASFDTSFYLETSPDIRSAGMNPFLHYVTAGVKEGRLVGRRGPAGGAEEREVEARLAAEVETIRASGRFDEKYYRAMNPGLPPLADALRHYCEHGWREGCNPSPDFDTAYYLKISPDIRNAGMNPFLHYVTAGITEGRPAHPATARRSEDLLAREIDEIRASGQFDEAFYLAMNGDIEPPPADAIRHYCERGWAEGRDPSDDFDTKAYLAAYRDIREAGINPFWHYVTAGAFELRKPHPGSAVRYEDDVWFGPIAADVKLLAFHACPDWASLRSPRGLVRGDTQPLLPHDDLGFYASADGATLKKQAALAKRHGVHGFCFALVPDASGASSPLAALLDLPEVDIGLCVMLDNTAFTGASETGLLKKACSDPRAVRVAGLPVIVVRPQGARQEVRSELEALRRALREQIGPVFLVAGWSEGAADALAAACAAGACDAVLDLPDPPVPRETGDYQLLVSDGIHAAPYSVVAAQGVARAHAAREAGFPLYQAISVGRDITTSNSPRRLVYKRFQVRHYRRWLDAALEAARGSLEADRRFVFLQSWNDWNKGQVLEPDRQGGYGRLNETSRALLGLPPQATMPKVSVVVPNYNHAPFLRRRLDSIYGQTYKNIEVILLDDCSSDGSRTVLDEYAAAYPEITRTLYNSSNSGGAFRQWAKGIKAATGDLVWIAESDDFCDERFLDVLVRSFDDEAVLLAYGQSVFIDKDGARMANDFQVYVRDLECAARWNGPYVETAHREVRCSLGIKNTIPNASGVLFRRPVDMPLLDDPAWLSMKVAGDWVFYLHVLRGGKVAFDPQATNYFRRYEGSTAETTYRKAAFFQEVGLACRTVAHLYDVPMSILERCRENYRKFYYTMVANSDHEFDAWFDFDAVLRARAERLPNLMVSTMGFFPGGAEIFPIRLANEFKRQGVSVLLLSTGLNPREDGVRRMLRNDVPLVETSEVEPVKEIIEQFGIEVLNTHQWHVQKYPMRVPDVFAGLRSHVATLHGMIEHGNAFSVTEEELRTADRGVGTWVYTAEKNLGPFVNFGMVQSDESRFIKMPNGIQTPRIEPVSRAHLDLPEDAFVLCCVSRAIPDKGWAETITAVERARELSGRDIRLVLVGNGPVYDDLRHSGVPPFVQLVGFSENSAGHYASADMGIMLTRFRSESFPLTIVDCLFAGRPYIATDVGDIRNMLSTAEGVAGAVIKLEDWQIPIEAAARAIAAFATDHARYGAAKALVPEIAARYRIEAVAASYVDLFRKSMSRPKDVGAVVAPEVSPALT